MNKKVIAAIAAALVALLAGWYFWQQSRPAAVPPPPPAALSAPVPEPPPPPPKAKPAIRYPLPATTMALPDLDGSDAPLRKALGDWLGQQALVLVFGDDLVRRIVRTVDSLPRAALPADAMLFKPVPGAFATVGKGDSLVGARRNAERYAPHVRVGRRLDAAKLAALYIDFYPLFQRAYEEQGNSDRYFNDRLVEAIDDLLAAPEPAGPVKLRRDNGIFEFADADLAGRSAGQKIMLRMGVANAAVVKAKLRALRREVAGEAGDPVKAPDPSAATGGSPELTRPAMR